MPELLYGPHTDTVRALLGSLEHARLLHPDASMAALDDAALRWLEERADEHLAALAPFADAPLGPARVSCVRSMDEAFEREDAAWEPFADASTGATGPLAGALYKAVDAAQKAAFAKALPSYPFALSEAAQAAVRGAIARTPSLPPALSNAPGDLALRPALASVFRHAEWLYAFGDARPSPYAPLVAIWFRGVWPLALPSGELLVYVPAWKGEALHPSPTSRKPHAIPVRQPRAAATTTALLTLEGCGFGPVPALPGTPLAVPYVPDFTNVMPPPGAPVAVSPQPFVEPEPPPVMPPTDAPPAPWYKRILGD